MLCTWQKIAVPPTWAGFKPLQSGALLCTHRQQWRPQRLRCVSNPFRAGHCCARARRGNCAMAAQVSNPFRAGHCCARTFHRGVEATAYLFQTPSERGIAVHMARSRPSRSSSQVSNPFRAGHCCARAAESIRRRAGSEFQTPSERGIAVHIRSLMAMPLPTTSFKPLQSGALLCTTPQSPPTPAMTQVSNPFRAGHCCAPPPNGNVYDQSAAFQTPSERGIAVHTENAPWAYLVIALVSNPFRAGHCCAPAPIQPR